MGNLFRVIGIQTDGSHIVLATHLMEQQAHAIIEALSQGARGPVFSRMLIEPQPDTGEMPRLPPLS